MRTTALHQSLADRIKTDIDACQALYRDDPNAAVAHAELSLRSAWSALQDRIIARNGCALAPQQAVEPRRVQLSIYGSLVDLRARAARMPKPRRRWSLARLLGLS